LQIARYNKGEKEKIIVLLQGIDIDIKRKGAKT
jgi:hypothetical protein